MSSTMSAAEGSVIQNPGRLPLFTAGKITALACADFLTAIRHFYSVKETLPEKQVAIALGCFEEIKVKNWIRPSAMHAKLCAMTIDEFMTTFRAKFLPHDWVEKTRKEVLSSRQTASQSFDDWSTHVVSLAALLQDDVAANDASSLAIDDKRLRHTLEAGMLEDLAHRHNGSDASKIGDDKFDLWCSAVIALDEERTYEDNKIKRMLAAAAASAPGGSTKRKGASGVDDERAGKKPFSASRKGNQFSSNGGTSTSTSASTPSSASLPALTEYERKLLNENSGCNKCRRFFVDHRSATCPNDFPDGTDYKSKTQADVDAAAPRKGKSKAVAAVVMPDIEDLEDSSDETSDSDP